MKPAEIKKDKLVEKSKKASLESKEKPVEKKKEKTAESKKKPAAVYNMSDSDDDLIWGNSSSNFF